jgi:flagellar hook-basal body protein
MAGSAFFTAASGLRNHQLRIDNIANNLANVNTAGYKAASVVFSDVLSQTLRGASAPTGDLGGINPRQVGLGMQVAAIHNLMQQSALENTSRPTDFAINGAGFFVLTDGTDEVYTRAGDFNVDKNGMLISGEGYKVQGYNKLTADGTAIDTGKGIGDIIIEFGKKLEARGSTWLDFRSNLDASSYRYGSANNDNANVGTTGILTFAGAAEPWTAVVGEPINAIPTGPETVTINGNSVTYDASGATSFEEVANIIAEAINRDPVMSVQMQATVREAENKFQLVLQGVSPGTSLDITTVGASSGLATGMYTSPTEPGAFLVGSNRITVTDAKSATGTASIPVGTGVNAPQTGETVVINGVNVTLAETYLATNTAAQNAVMLAREINETPGITVVATANANGTITLTHSYAGQQRQAGPSQVDGAAISALTAGPETMIINGTTITYDTSGSGTMQQASIDIAAAITAALGPNVTAASYNPSPGNWGVQITSTVPATTTVDITNITSLANTGLVTNSDLADIRVSWTQQARYQGVPLTGFTAAGDSVDINGVTVNFNTSASGTLQQAALDIVTAINGTPGVGVAASVGTDGTNYWVELSSPADILIDTTATLAPNALGFASGSYALDNVGAHWGFNSYSGFTAAALGGTVSIDNGQNARAELVFTPEDGSPALARFYEDWAYDRSQPASPAGFVYTNSTLSNVQSAIEGAGASFPLLPGVNISIDALSAGQANFRTESAFTHTTSRPVYDSLGNAHNLTTTFTHVNENTWDFEVTLPEEPNILLTNATGRITFSSDGLITSGNPTLPVSFTAPGASPTQVDLRYDGNGQAINGITQYAAATTTAAREQDGYTMGVLTDFEADASGTIVGYYSNGQRRPIAQIALATFSNPEGLERIGSTSFGATTNSGSAVKLQPGTGGSGVVYNGYVEQSNVDMALEFTNLIITERGLQANSRVFTTQDEILNEIVNLKR